MNSFIISEERLALCRNDRTAKRERSFSKLESTLGKGAVHELRRLYGMYDESMYLWLARLWDGEFGGFYYSNSARDNDGFLPDVESTAQALRHTVSSGLFLEQGCWSNALGINTKQKLISFVRSMQSSEDGFFYHPQWGKEITVSRRGRDLGWATYILRTLGVSPLYDTPNGIKGELGAPLSAKNAAFENTTSVASPEHLQTLDAFKGYLDSLELTSKSYYTGNLLNAQRTQIQAAGTEFCKLFYNYMKERQNKENGLFEDEVTYSSVNGFFKIGSVISAMGYPIPNAEAALKSVMQMSLTKNLTPESSNHVCSLYNCWVILDFLISDAEKYNGTHAADKIRRIVYDNAEELIRLSYNKMQPFKKADGGFSYKPNNSASKSQSAPVAIPGTAESDVNATCIMSTGMSGRMAAVFGATDLKIFGKEDGRLFAELIANSTKM